ncbi:hypothetical protein TNCT_559861 [Trichonephila clavata]|uniref:Uncharacterized protein n=1 Tax=Trichonephila clavata TaxID=2740835 RepID=A0A8X6L446_TRICU|nr:hypothetical protein TNCT_559861 [Trichonephila clavata]
MSNSSCSEETMKLITSTKNGGFSFSLIRSDSKRSSSLKKVFINDDDDDRPFSCITCEVLEIIEENIFSQGENSDWFDIRHTVGHPQGTEM